MSDSELDDFLSTTLARQIEADRALHNGDPEPRLALWSRNDPVTVVGAARSATGWDEVSQLFRWLGTRFSNCDSFTFDLLVADLSGDMAYTVGYEHTSASIGGAPAEPYTLRVTHVYRRENGEWKIAHRHADPVGGPLSLDQSPPAEAPTT
jgi:ketosteroid isomerase-like protein